MRTDISTDVSVVAASQPTFFSNFIIAIRVAKILRAKTGLIIKRDDIRYLIYQPLTNNEIVPRTCI
jgi:hypothetical protein